MSKASPFGLDFPVCRIFGVQVRADITLLVIGGLYAWNFGGVKMGLIAFVMVFGSVLLHEFGHIFATRAVGGHSNLVVLWPFGGLAYTWVPPRAGANFIVTICGPLVNLVLLIIAIIVGKVGVIHGNDGWALLGFFMEINTMLLLFNLIPAFPMDGGRILQSILWPFIGYQKSLKWSSFVGMVVAGVVAAYSLWKQEFFLMFMMLWLASYAYQIFKAADGPQFRA